MTYLGRAMDDRKRTAGPYSALHRQRSGRVAFDAFEKLSVSFHDGAHAFSHHRFIGSTLIQEALARGAVHEVQALAGFVLQLLFACLQPPLTGTHGSRRTAALCRDIGRQGFLLFQVGQLLLHGAIAVVGRSRPSHVAASRPAVWFAANLSFAQPVAHPGRNLHQTARHAVVGSGCSQTSPSLPVTSVLRRGQTCFVHLNDGVSSSPEPKLK